MTIETYETPERGRPPENWEEQFIKALAETGNVKAACHVSGVGRATAYRRRNDNPDFAAAWESAIEESVDILEIEARRRALKGIDKPVYQSGKKVGDIKEYSDTLMIFLLKGNRPDKYRDYPRKDNPSLADAAAVLAAASLILKHVPPGSEAAVLENIQRELDESSSFS